MNRRHRIVEAGPAVVIAVIAALILIVGDWTPAPTGELVGVQGYHSPGKPHPAFVRTWIVCPQFPEPMGCAPEHVTVRKTG